MYNLFLFVFCGIGSLRHQHILWLQLGHERRHGHWQQPRARAGWLSSHTPQPTAHGFYLFNIPLSIGNELSSLPQHTIHLLIIIVPDYPGPEAHLFSSKPRADGSRQARGSSCPLRPSLCWARQHFLLRAPNFHCLHFVGKFPCVDLNFNFAALFLCSSSILL